MVNFPMRYVLQFVDFDTGLNYKIAFYELKVYCEKRIELGTLLQRGKIIGIFRFACETGSSQSVKYSLSREEIARDNLGRGLRNACFSGYRELTELLMLKEAIICNWGLHGACMGGRKELAELMISREGAGKYCNNCHKNMWSHSN
jgi:hypothetical protein